MSQKVTKASKQLNELLSFQDCFLELTHSQVYHSNLPFAESILKFQINHISEVNDKFQAAITTLTQDLLEKKIGYEGDLREQFQRLLQTDYLPLLRINRYEITKISLFGFDIYVEPLEAFLQILSRLEQLKQKILKGGLQGGLAENAENALEKGWQGYSIYANCWKLSFNLYILKQYLMVGNKSFLRKDREILFTGINNFYTDFVPFLKNKKCHKMLLEIGELNNYFYLFHPSFSFFQFYALLLPLNNELEPVFANMKEITEKCLRTNIITPLLFGILRNRESFLRFIKEADSQIWLPYLNTIIAGIAINLKFRILQYDEILQIFEEAVLKAGLLGALRTDQILGNLDEGWKEAKDFFISAVKIGFNSNEAETWKPVSLQAIGERVIESLLNGMLLGLEANSQNLRKYLQNGDEKLDAAVRAITHDKFDIFFVKSTICQLQDDIKDEKQLLNLIQICNLIKIFGMSNQYSLNFVVSCFNRIAIVPSRTAKIRLNEAAANINDLLFQLATPNLTFLKQKIAKFHIKFPPTANFPQLLEFYFGNFQPKKCLHHLLTLKIQENKSQSLLQLVFEKFIPKPAYKKIILKTFDKQFKTNNCFINVPYQSHCLLNFVTAQLTKGNKMSEMTILNLIKVCPWVSFALLNFPTNDEGDLLSFSSWLIDNKAYHSFLHQLLQKTRDVILSDNGIDLIKLLIYPSMLDHISKRINQVSEFQELKGLCNLAIRIGIEIQANMHFSIDLLSVLLHLLDKANNSDHIVNVVKDIAQLGQFAFKDKLSLWLMFLMQKRIEGRSQLSIAYRKNVLKTNHANIYFLGDVIEDAQSKAITSKSQKKSPSAQPSVKFEKSLRDLARLNFDEFKKLNSKQSILFLEEVKLFSVPSKTKIILKQLFSSNQPSVIDFLSLNFENHSIFVQFALEEGNTDFLNAQRFDKNLVKYVPRILNLQKSAQVNILQAVSRDLALEEKKIISESFFIDQSVLPLYCDRVNGMEYLAIFNNNNWRILMEYFAKEFSHSNLPSIILQYHEFVNITSKNNVEYEKSILKYASLFENYVNLFVEKIKSIFSLPYSTEQLSLRSANEISSLNIMISSLQLKEILGKLALLNKKLEQKGIKSISLWVQAAKTLNQSLNRYYQGSIMLSNFICAYYYTNQHIYDTLKTEIGVYLERYEQVVNQKASAKHYLPTELKRLSLKQFKEYKIVQTPFVLQSNISQTVISKDYIQLLKKMQQSGLIKVEGKKISINQIKKTSPDDQRLFYMFGCFHALAGQIEKYELSHLLQFVTTRQKWPWELLKLVNNDGYSHITKVIDDPEITKKNLTFTYFGEPLITNAEIVKVTEYNKIEYCNRIGLKIIGEGMLSYLKKFMRGFVYQQSQK